jgi:hypothetical protein
LVNREHVAFGDDAWRLDFAEESGARQLAHGLDGHPVLPRDGLEDPVVTWNSWLLDRSHDAAGRPGDSAECNLGPEPHRRSSPVVLQISDGRAGVDHDIRSEPDGGDVDGT